MTLKESPKVVKPSIPSNPEPEIQVDRVPVVKQNILRALGMPTNMKKMSITPVGSSHYRVTIYCARENKVLMLGWENFIAHSIWIKVNAEGDILSSDPLLVKTYE